MKSKLNLVGIRILGVRYFSTFFMQCGADRWMHLFCFLRRELPCPSQWSCTPCCRVRNGPPYDSILYEGFQQAMGEEGEKYSIKILEVKPEVLLHRKIWRCRSAKKEIANKTTHIERLQEFRDGFFCGAIWSGMTISNRIYNVSIWSDSIGFDWT